MNERGEFLNPGYTYESEFLFLGAVQNKRSFINKNKTETKDPNHQDWLDTLDTTSSHQIKDATIATLTALVLILVGLASVKLIMRAMGRRKSWSIRPGSPQRTPKTPPTKRITLEDIEVATILPQSSLWQVSALSFLMEGPPTTSTCFPCLSCQAAEVRTWKHWMTSQLPCPEPSPLSLSSSSP